MSSEIASRDLADENRYNALPEIAKRMGLPMSNRALWKVNAIAVVSFATMANETYCLLGPRRR
jgi:nitric-oxide synthase, bacterial